MRLRFLLLTLALASVSALRADDSKTYIDSDQMTVDSADSGTTFVWQGHVLLTATDIEVHSDNLRGEMAGKGDPLSGSASYGAYKYMLATGHVRILYGEYVATCGRAELFPQENRIVLTESPVVTSPRGEQRGEKITFTKDAAGHRHIDVVQAKTDIRGLKGVNLGSPKPDAGDDGGGKPAPPPIAK